MMMVMEDYKPDMLILLKLKCNFKIDFSICEIKKPGYSSNKYESDFVRIHREMKAIIDDQVNIGLASPFCYGFLVEGFDGHLYKMALMIIGTKTSRRNQSNKKDYRRPFFTKPVKRN